MSQYYNPKRTRNVYDPGEIKPFKVSRSKIDLFIECPRCFYLDRRLGVGRPPGFPFNLNSAVDTLLKKEFDVFRALGTPHPLMQKNDVDAVPFAHPDLDEWRENFKGVQYTHTPTRFTVTGAVDDIWINSAGELIVVDYKSTAKNGVITLDEKWKDGYKRQMEVYQWLLRRNMFEVSDMGYFVYANGITKNDTFDNKLEFEVTLLPYTGNDAWVEDVLYDMYACLHNEEIPPPGPDCDHCAYREAARREEG